MPLLTPWVNATRRQADTPALPASPFELTTSLAAASCWYSISFAKAALRVAELMAVELSNTAPDGTR
jgi:hypothetical protein